MTPEDVLQLLFSKLDECGVSYMITGSFASNIHGVPRATQDADVIIDVEQTALERLLESLGSAFYLNSESGQGSWTSWICWRGCFRRWNKPTKDAWNSPLETRRPIVTALPN